MIKLDSDGRVFKEYFFNPEQEKLYQNYADVLEHLVAAWDEIYAAQGLLIDNDCIDLKEEIDRLDIMMDELCNQRTNLELQVTCKNLPLREVQQRMNSF